jgi:cold shock protein
MHRVVRGTVKTWHDEEGWGVLVSPRVDGDVFAHFGHIEAEGYRALDSGATVDFEYEPYPEGQDEGDEVYYYRATRVREAAG